MSQSSFEFPLNDFELLTLEALVNYKADTTEDKNRLLTCDKLKNEVRIMVNRWNSNRIEAGLIAYK